MRTNDGIEIVEPEVATAADIVTIEEAEETYYFHDYDNMPCGERAFCVRPRDGAIFVSAVFVGMALGADHVDWYKPVRFFDDSEIHYYVLDDVIEDYPEIFKEIVYTRRSIDVARRNFRELVASREDLIQRVHIAGDTGRDA